METHSVPVGEFPESGGGMHVQPKCEERSRQSMKKCVEIREACSDENMVFLERKPSKVEKMLSGLIREVEDGSDIVDDLKTTMTRTQNRVRKNVGVEKSKEIRSQEESESVETKKRDRVDNKGKSKETQSQEKQYEVSDEDEDKSAESADQEQEDETNANVAEPDDGEEEDLKTDETDEVSESSNSDDDGSNDMFVENSEVNTELDLGSSSTNVEVTNDDNFELSAMAIPSGDDDALPSEETNSELS